MEAVKSKKIPGEVLEATKAILNQITMHRGHLKGSQIELLDKAKKGIKLYSDPKSKANTSVETTTGKSGEEGYDILALQIGLGELSKECKSLIMCLKII